MKEKRVAVLKAHPTEPFLPYWQFSLIFYILFLSSTHMQDLQEVTQEVHYENYRSERLAKGAPVPKRTT